MATRDDRRDVFGDRRVQMGAPWRGNRRRRAGGFEPPLLAAFPGYLILAIKRADRHGGRATSPDRPAGWHVARKLHAAYVARCFHSIRCRNDVKNARTRCNRGRACPKCVEASTSPRAVANALAREASAPFPSVRPALRSRARRARLRRAADCKVARSMSKIAISCAIAQRCRTGSLRSAARFVQTARGRRRRQFPTLIRRETPIALRPFI
jgi:hypothetical protein